MLNWFFDIIEEILATIFPSDDYYE